VSHQFRALRGLEDIEKEATRWYDAILASDPAARARFDRVMADAPRTPNLGDVQHALALEHGFTGWTALEQAVAQAEAAGREAGAQALERYDAMAAALLEAYRTGTPEAMERHHNYTWHRRAWKAMRTYVQLDLGKRPTDIDDPIDITLDDARHLVALEHGFKHWNDLEAFTRGQMGGHRVLAKPLRLVVRKNRDEWQAIASARDWDEILQLLTGHPQAGLSGEGQITDTMLSDLSQVPALTALGLAGCKGVTDAGVRHLARLPALRHLDLSGTSVSDSGLQVLRDLPLLQTVSLAWTGVSAEGLGVLAHCDRIEDVNVMVIPQAGEQWAARAGDAALRALAGKHTLRHLEICLTDDGLAGLQEIPAFKFWQGGETALGLLGPKVLPNHLSLRGPFTDRGMTSFPDLEGLFSLDINSPRLSITARGVEPLVSLPRLGALSLDAKNDWMPYVAAMPRLQHLGVQDTAAGDEGFVALSGSRSIEYIWGRRCHNLRRRGFIALAQMPALRGLSVSCLNVDDAGVSALPSFPALTELMPMDVRDEGYRHIGACQRLESLILMYCRETTDTATGHITGLKRLSSYFNSYTTVTDRTPELLSTMDSLERVTFDACHNLTDAGITRLARLPHLRELRASGRGITSNVRGAFPARVKLFLAGQ
jgi:hypothetical protein